MKTKEIKINGVYSDGKKAESLRRVTGLFDEYYDKALENNAYYVSFKCIKGRNIGCIHSPIMLTSFARWAHHEVVS